jgi:hypothetical protein
MQLSLRFENRHQTGGANWPERHTHRDCQDPNSNRHALVVNPQLSVPFSPDLLAPRYP